MLSRTGSAISTFRCSSRGAPRDPVFNDDFAADLAARLPDTVLHRFGNANHLVMPETGEGDSSVAAAAERFIATVISNAEPSTVTPRLRPEVGDPVLGDVVANDDFRGLWAGVLERRDDRRVGFADMATGDELRFDELAVRIESIAADLHRRGLESGDRVAMLTPPGVDLVAAVYGVWRAGGVTVVADRGLGLRGSVPPFAGLGPRG